MNVLSIHKNLIYVELHEPESKTKQKKLYQVLNSSESFLQQVTEIKARAL